jgi:hypothetical protein
MYPVYQPSEVIFSRMNDPAARGWFDQRRTDDLFSLAGCLKEPVKRTMTPCFSSPRVFPV